VEQLDEALKVYREELHGTVSYDRGG